MNTEETLNLPDDTEGNVAEFGADAEATETDDTEGHILGGVFPNWEPDKKVLTQESDVLRP
jgi:hypothetical protein